MNKAINAAKTIVFSVLAVFMIIALTITTSYVNVNAQQPEYIDNSSLITPWVPDSEVQLDEKGWPTWVDDIIIAEGVPNKLGKGGTLLKDDVEPMLKHLAQTGANLLWMTPVQDMGTDPAQITYTNYGPHTINPYLTGQLAYGEDWRLTDYEEGRRILSEFVDLCHSYNIRVMFDFTVWGVAYSSPLFTEKPDWFTGASVWGGYEIKNDSVEVYNFYHESVLDFILDTGCDGIRWDLEPTEFAYDLVEDIHSVLLEKGRKVIFVSEHANFRGTGYTFEQCYGINGDGVDTQHSVDCFFDDMDIVEAIRTGDILGHADLRANGESGQYRHYAYQISSHDNVTYHRANMAEWAYQYLYGSIIPLFYIGEEWCSSYKGGCYGATIADFEEQLKDPAKREYFESVKELIGYKWKYKHLVNKTTENHRETNICTVYLKGTTHVQGYARYSDDEAFIVVPNVNLGTTDAVQMTVDLPFENMELDNYTTYVVKDVRTDKVVVQGDAKAVNKFKATIDHNTCGLYYLTAQGKIDPPVKENVAETDTTQNSTQDKDDNTSQDTSAETETETETILVKKPKKTTEIMYVWSPWATVGIIAGVLLVAGTVTAIIVIKKKKSK